MVEDSKALTRCVISLFSLKLDSGWVMLVDQMVIQGLKDLVALIPSAQYP